MVKAIAVLALVGSFFLLAGAVPGWAASTGQITVDLTFSADEMGREVLARTQGIGQGTFTPTDNPSFFDISFGYVAPSPDPLPLPAFMVKGEGRLMTDGGGRMDLLVTSLTDLEGKPLPVVDPSGDGTPNTFELQLAVQTLGFDPEGMIQVPGTNAFLVQPVPIQIVGGPLIFLPRRDHIIRGPEPSVVLLLGAGVLGVGAAALKRGA